MVGNREIPSSARLWLLTLLAGASACTSVLGIEDLHEGPRAAAGSENGGGTDVSASGKSSGAGSNNGGATNDGGASNNGGNGAAGSGNSTNAGSGGASGTGTSGTAPVEGTVHGKVIDLWESPLANVPIQIGDQVGTTDANGEFSFDDVPAEYDASLKIQIENPPSDYGWVYQGLTRRNPTLQVYQGRQERSATVEVATQGVPKPKPADHEAVVAFGMPVGARTGTVDTETGTYFEPSWLGANETPATVHALLWSSNETTKAPTAYKAYASQAIKKLVEGTGNDKLTFDLTPTTVDTGTISGAITPAASGNRINRLFARFESHATIRLMDQDSAPNTFSYLAPSLPKAALTVAAFEGTLDGQFGVAHADGLKAGASAVTLTIPSPGQALTPAGPTTGAFKDQTFTFTSGQGKDSPCVIWIERDDLAYYSMYVVTTKRKFKVPEVVGGAFTLAMHEEKAPQPEYVWSVQAHGNFQSVDAMAGPDGFIDSFGWRHGDPSGPSQQDGTFSTSAKTAFTTTIN